MATNREIVYILRLNNQSKQALAQFGSSIRKQVPELRKLATGLRNVDRESKKAATSLRRMGTSGAGIRNLTKSIKSLSTQSTSLKKLSERVRAINAALKSQKGSTQLSTTFKNATTSAKQFSDVLKKIQTQLKSINASGQRLRTVGKAAATAARSTVQAPAATRVRPSVPLINPRTISATKKFNKSLKDNGELSKKFREQIRRSAASIALLDGPLGGIASRVTALGTLFGSGGLKIGAYALAIAGLGVALGAAAKAGIKLERQQNRLQALLVATSNASNQSVGSIEEISREIGESTLASTSDVRDAAAQLLTFKSISGDAFKTTLVLAQDLAETGFGTVQTATVQLAKALEDPILGLTALKRSGVSFSVAQKDLIVSLIETGKQAEAQAIILKGVAGQVAGAGKAAADGVAGAFDTFKEKFGFFLTDFAEASGVLIGLRSIIDSATAGMKFLVDNVESVVAAMKGLLAAVIALFVMKSLILVSRLLGSAIIGLSLAAKTATFSLAGLRAAIIAVWAIIAAHPIGRLVVAFAALVGWLIASNKEITIFGESFRFIDLIAAAWEVLTLRVEAFVKAIKSISIGDFDEASKLLSEARKIGGINQILANAKLRTDAWRKSLEETAKKFKDITGTGADFQAASPEAIARLKTFNKKLSETLRDMRIEVILARRFGTEREKSLKLIELANDAIVAGILNQEGGLEILNKKVAEYAAAWDEVKALTADNEGAIRGMGFAVTDFIEKAKDDFDTFKNLTKSVIDGLTDAFVEFTETGQFNFKKMLASVAAEITRAAFKRSLATVFESLGLDELFKDDQKIDAKQAVKIAISLSKEFSPVITSSAQTFSDTVVSAAEQMRSTLAEITLDFARKVDPTLGEVERKDLGPVAGLSKAAQDAEKAATKFGEVNTGLIDINTKIKDLIRELNFADIFGDRELKKALTEAASQRAAELKAASSEASSNFTTSAQTFANIVVGAANNVATALQQSPALGFGGSPELAGQVASVSLSSESINQISGTFKVGAETLNKAQTDVARAIFDFFISKGYTPTQSAGVVGNAFAESGFDPSAVNSIGAIGIFQHLTPSRQKELADVAEGMGVSVLNLTAQLETAYKELQTTEGSADRALKAVKEGDTRGAASAFAGFERPEGFGTAEGVHDLERRAAGAAAALQAFTGTIDQSQSQFRDAISDFNAHLQQAAQSFGAEFTASMQQAVQTIQASLQSGTIQGSDAVRPDLFVGLDIAIQELATKAQSMGLTFDEFLQVMKTNLQGGAEQIGVAMNGAAQTITAGAQQAAASLDSVPVSVEQEGQTFSQGLGSVFDFLVGKLGGLASGLLGDLGPIFNGIVSILKQLFSALDQGGEGGGIGGLLGKIFGSVFHDGGIVGQTQTKVRAVNPEVFRNAKKLHSGSLKSDEVAAILQKGEIVLSKDDIKALQSQTERSKQSSGFLRSPGQSIGPSLMQGGGSAAGGMVTNNIIVKNTIVANDPNAYRQTLSQQATEARRAMDRSFQRNA